MRISRHVRKLGGAGCMVFALLFGRAHANNSGKEVVSEGSNTNVRVHAFVSGRVQGVGFRYFTARKATELGVVGWVKNLPDGRVEIMAEGATNIVERLMEFVNEGPAAAKVVKLERKTEPHQAEFQKFKTLY